MYEFQNEENLLQGVQLTTSISCHNPSDASAQSKFEHYEDHSFKMQDLEFYLSSNEDQESTASINLSSNFNLTQTQTKVKSDFSKVSSQKKRFNRLSNKKHFWEKRQSDRKLSKLINMDSKLVQIKVSGLFDRPFEVINRLTQVILTQQFCKYRVYQKKLLQIIKDLEFCMSEFQKQKKSLINQINLLKSDNQNLMSTVYSLSDIVKQLQQSFERYSSPKQNSVQSFLFHSSSKNKRREENNHFVSSFGCFDKTQKTFQQIKKGRQIQNSIQQQNFAEILSDISYRLNKISEGQVNLYKNIQQKNGKSAQTTSGVINQINSISALVSKLQNHKSQSIMTFAGQKSQQTNSQKLMVKFLTTLSRNKQHFLKKIEQSENKAKQFWFIVHSSLFTFIGILINQAKNSSTDILQSKKKQWCNKFLEQILQLKKTSSIALKQTEETYFKNIQNLLNDIEELTNRAMNRSNKQ